MSWTDRLAPLDAPAKDALANLKPVTIPAGTVLFRPGDSAQGFVVVLSGRAEVFLTGPNGREILLYAIEPGQSCIQSTLGLMGGEAYNGEAITAADCTVVIIPKPLFLRLLDESAPFRALIFTTFGRRMQDMMRLFERVAFQKVEIRLAAALLSAACGSRVEITQADLAVRIGTAREVVSRQLEKFANRGWVRTERGLIHLLNMDELRRLALVDSAESRVPA